MWDNLSLLQHHLPPRQHSHSILWMYQWEWWCCWYWQWWSPPEFQDLHHPVCPTILQMMCPCNMEDLSLPLSQSSFRQWYCSALIRVRDKGRQWRDVNCGLVRSILCRTHGWVEYVLVFDVDGLPWWYLNLWKKRLVKLPQECLLRLNQGCWIQLTH